MRFNIHFKSLEDEKDLKGLIDFLSKQDLGYPKYNEWVQRAEAELTCGYKQALMAFDDFNLVGDLVFQPHKNIARFLELKNLRVSESVRLRDFGRFMLKQMEYSAGRNYDAVLCDVRSNQKETISFFESCGYELVGMTSLYDPSIAEVIMLKVLNKFRKESSSSLVKKYVERNKK